MSTQESILAVRSALSAARMETYEIATSAITGADFSALVLYAWNAQVSAALLAPLHICEVVIRNAISDAIEAVYGSRWPWSIGFEQSLPAPKLGYSPRRDLQTARSRAPSTGKVIPELKFVFWQKMFTSRHEPRLWNMHLLQVLPHMDSTMPVNALCRTIYEDLEQVRILRNRIAHHEPIFTRPLTDDLQRIVRLVELRSKLTAEWMLRNQQASTLIQARP